MPSVVISSAQFPLQQISSSRLLVLVWFHIQAVPAFWSFTWTNLLRRRVLYWVAVGLGISMGYHRLHTHRGFKTYKCSSISSRSAAR